jgi:hypothetical protein
MSSGFKGKQATQKKTGALGTKAVMEIGIPCDFEMNNGDGGLEYGSCYTTPSICSINDKQVQNIYAGEVWIDMGQMGCLLFRLLVGGGRREERPGCDTCVAIRSRDERRIGGS